jgi:murein L,D-transpeptidase YcbB/YkuD
LAVTLSAGQVALIVQTLGAAEAEGLPRLRQTDSGTQADLVADLLRYARAVHSGQLEAADFPDEWGLRPEYFDPLPGFQAAVAADRLKEWLASLPPNYAGYRALRRGLADYRAINAGGGWSAIPDGPPLSLGAQGARVAALRARLAVEDKEAPPVAAQFDEATQAAVMRAQRRYGLKPDGVVAASTLAALNQPVSQRILQILANMERWRWLPAVMPATRLQVNSAAAIVTLFRDDRPVLSMKAVAGRPGDETPMLAASITSIVINPPWNVPASIAEKELWPKERKSPGYLRRSGFSVIAAEGGGRRLQQAAGDRSALGRFKFDFENPYGVYLHDTPTKATFARFSRQASHGCVRLEKPAALAQALLDGDPQWTPEAIAAAVDKGDTVRARLPAATPVLILYWTAFAGADGHMNFRADPYDWDRTLLHLTGVLGGGQQAAA